MAFASTVQQSRVASRHAHTCARVGLHGSMATWLAAVSTGIRHVWKLGPGSRAHETARREVQPEV